eukprot:Platyproteum_vivax@DN10868_c0_g1_i1.p1
MRENSDIAANTPLACVCPQSCSVCGGFKTAPEPLPDESYCQTPPEQFNCQDSEELEQSLGVGCDVVVAFLGGMSVCQDLLSELAAHNSITLPSGLNLPPNAKLTQACPVTCRNPCVAIEAAHPTAMAPRIEAVHPTAFPRSGVPPPIAEAPYRPDPVAVPYRPQPTAAPYRPAPQPTAAPSYRPTEAPYRPQPTAAPYRPAPQPTAAPYYRPTEAPYRPAPAPTAAPRSGVPASPAQMQINPTTGLCEDNNLIYDVLGVGCG